MFITIGYYVQMQAIYFYCVSAYSSASIFSNKRKNFR